MGPDEGGENRRRLTRGLTPPPYRAGVGLTINLGNARSEHDPVGEIGAPADALYGAQTQRAVENFPISGLRFPRSFLRALGLIKSAAARVNGRLGELPADLAAAIEKAANAVADRKHHDQFLLDIFQTRHGPH